MKENKKAEFINKMTEITIEKVKETGGNDNGDLLIEFTPEGLPTAKVLFKEEVLNDIALIKERCEVAYDGLYEIWFNGAIPTHKGLAY